MYRLIYWKNQTLEFLGLKKPWIDPDDAPELDEEWFKNAHYYEGGKLVKRGKGKLPKNLK